MKKTIEKWYVFYTKSRAEKKAMIQLQRKDVPVYLPLIKEIRQWSDRKKTVEAPLFRSYIFIKCAEHEIPELLQWHPNLVTFVRYNGKPAVISEDELTQIQKYIDTGYHITAEADENLSEGDMVKVLDGPLKNTEGEILNVKNNRYLIVRIQALSQYLKVQLPREILLKI